MVVVLNGCLLDKLCGRAVYSDDTLQVVTSMWAISPKVASKSATLGHSTMLRCEAVIEQTGTAMSTAVLRSESETTSPLFNRAGHKQAPRYRFRDLNALTADCARPRRALPSPRRPTSFLGI
jgi:hypothetical protein